MAPKVKSVAGARKPLENGSSNGEAVVSSTSESPNGDVDAAVVAKTSTGGRKAKKEISIEKYEKVEQKLSEKNATNGRGRGRKKATTTEVSEEPINEEDLLENKKKAEIKSRGKKLATNVVDNKASQIVEESVVKSEKSSAKKARKTTPIYEAPKEITNNTEVLAALITSPKNEKPMKAPGKRGRKAATIDITSEATVEKKGKRRLPKQSEPVASTNEVMVENEIKSSKGVPTKKRPLKKSTQNEEVKIELKEDALDKTDAQGAKKNTKKSQAASVDNVEKPAKAEKTTKRKAAKEVLLASTATEIEHETNHSARKKTKKIEDNEEPKLKSNSKSKKSTKPQENNINEHLDSGGVEKEKKPRGRKRALAIDDNNADDVDGAKPTKAKKPTAAAPLNSTSTKYNKADFALVPSVDGETSYNLKISSWNVAGLRSWLKKDGLRFLDFEEPDIFCLQEIKCTIDQLPDEVARIPGYHPYWLCMPGGYAGVAIYSKIMPINVEYGIGDTEFDDAGRIITAEYEKFYLINVYVPNSGRKLVNLEPRMRWEKLFQVYVQRLDALKPVIICGDMNVSHQEIDLANPKTNTRNAGFTQEERDKMSELLSLGYVDTFRYLYPTRTGAYSFWTYMGNARSRNVGWRLDYFILSERIIKRVVENCMRAQVMGSDHCPITLFVNM